MAYFPKQEEITGRIGKADTKAIRGDFDVLLAVRDEALKALEIARQEKLIGRSEEATITIQAPEATAKLLERYRDDFRFLMVVSGVEIVSAPSGNGNTPVHVTAKKAPGGKCDRCWFYSTHVGESERYPTACERCLKALEEIEKALPV
jgi:isoleucyl-tRNA synthetase